jgi:hypothetical protein
MAYVISSVGVSPKIQQKTQILSCMKEAQDQLKNQIYDAECIQKRINEAAKVRARLDAEIKERYENIKHINFLG